MAAPRPLLSALTHLITLLFIVRVKNTEIDIPPLVIKHFIYGDLNHKVNVYVKMLKNSPFLACMDVGIAHEATIDPFFFWIGPDGRNLKGQSNVNITETGKLMLKAFDKSMSGSYSCTLYYKRIKNDVTQEKKKSKSYEFAVFAYLDPDYMYQINVRYMAKPCSELTNARFVSTLFMIIREVITGLNCHLKSTYHKCHVIKAPKHSLQNELFIAFKARDHAFTEVPQKTVNLPHKVHKDGLYCKLSPKEESEYIVIYHTATIHTHYVNPFSHGWDKECFSNSYGCQKETSLRLEKAKNLIVEFFRMQTRVLEEEFVNIPEINYIEHSLDIIRVDSCRPGFGKNEVTHHDCPGCCVVCDPGTYSSDNSTHCEICKDIKITYYGATDC